MIQMFAQATRVPENGASRAEDFQPLTRNPQAAGGGVQSGVEPQSAGGQDILNHENARIIVPTNDVQTATPMQTTANGASINWFLVIVISIILVALLEYVFRRREKAPIPKQVSSVGSALPQDTVAVPASSVQEITSSKKKVSARSKSKRKKSRK